MDQKRINVGVVGRDEMGILHTGILSSLDGVEVKWLQFLKLVRSMSNSEEDYVKFQQFQAEWVFNRLKLENKLGIEKVLDLGCGLGGYTKELSKYARVVYALDLHVTQKYFRSENVIPIQGDALNIPLKGNSVDFIFCSSLIEHIQDQNKLVSEIKRVLKPDGICYLSFPPFYSPVGGHQFKPFHLLGEKNAIILSRIFKGIKAKDYATYFGDFVLNPTTISKIKRLVKRSNFRIVDMRTRFSPINVAKIPILGEFLTWHVEFVLRKEV
ncbi:hypothetical protein ES705_19582 [subsurface metagenome]